MDDLNNVETPQLLDVLSEYTFSHSKVLVDVIFLLKIDYFLI